MDNPVGAPAQPKPRKGPVYAWWLVLCLVGLDYFSTLAYLPSMAAQADRMHAPLAAALVAALTLLAALPVYLYVVGRSPHGSGATGLLERLVHGWSGKVFILILLGFVATDFIVTRTLSVADAAIHITHNPFWRAHVDWVESNKETVRNWFPELLRGSFFDFWNEQLVVTVILFVLTFLFYAFIARGFNKPFMYLAAAVVILFLVVNGIVVGQALSYLAGRTDRIQTWIATLRVHTGGEAMAPLLLFLALSALVHAPQIALGLSGFELSMTSAPLVRGRADDDPEHPRGRIRRTRLLLCVAAVIMSLFVVGSVTAVSQLVPQAALDGTARGDEEANGPAMHRALAYLAHGGRIDAHFLAPVKPMEGRAPVAQDAEGEALCDWFGQGFGTLYDVSTVLILCLAGASVAIGMRQLVPQYLARFGMQLQWAEKVGVILHLFNLAILVMTLFFHASVSAQQWAYAASVMVLLASAGLAAHLDLRHRWQRSAWKGIVTLPSLLMCILFLLLVGLVLWQSRSGLYIPVTLVLVILITGFLSRWLRSTELRFQGFDFVDDASRARWDEICRLEFQVLVPHRPDHLPLAEKDREIRAQHRMGPDVPIIFVEAELGDPSDFLMRPVMQVEKRDGFEVIRLSRCASIAHVLAAIGLAFSQVGRPPEIHFGWSEEPPMAANLGFLLFGEGNIPWMVHALIRKAEHDPVRQPRVIVG